jgi:DNA-binding transcriptional ArsR family regulator
VETYEVLDALGDGTRRAVLETLRDGPKPVVEIARVLPVSRPAVSQHLKVLKDAGLVRADRDGTRRLYSLDPTGLAHLHRYVEDFWKLALIRFKEEVER